MKKTLLHIWHNLLNISLLVSIILLNACSGVDELNEPTRLIVSLVDSPADYAEVNVDIQEISLKTEGTEENNGWIVLNDFKPGVYNILEFTGGQELPLANMIFPDGAITGIKMKLGDNNTLTIDDYSSTLLVPGLTSNGIIISIFQNIKAGETNVFKIDFDASRSVSRLGTTGQMILQPVLKLISANTTGIISGSIIPAEKNVLVNVISGNEIIASSYAPENSSKFSVPGIESGTYTISFESSSHQKHIHNVSVSNGNVTDMGIIRLED